jgi:hypothetical protein
MIRVGLVGEDPNDTSSIKNLLNKRYKGRVQFYQLLRRITGNNLDSGKIKRVLPVEFEEHECNFVIYIRDLDALKSHSDKLQARIRWFKELDAVVNSQGLLLLNIWELEALILGDVDTFNKIYKTKHTFPQNPMHVKQPKELLKQVTFKSKNKFHESHCPEIFKQLDIDKIEANCSCFKEFIEEFDAKLK